MSAIEDQVEQAKLIIDHWRAILSCRCKGSDWKERCCDDLGRIWDMLDVIAEQASVQVEPCTLVEIKK